MSPLDAVDALRREMEQELARGILPYWMERARDPRRGGFVGSIGADDVPDPEAPRGSILNARIVWTFSAAYAALDDPAYRLMADGAAEWFLTHFIDPRHGGVYWMIAADGTPVDARKHVYAQAFAVYALAEHARATGSEASLDAAIALFRLIERHAHDDVHGGYQEAFSREWALLDDARLSEVDADERKSMNTHLHLLEAYTALHRVWPDARVSARLRELAGLFLDRIVISASAHMSGFFDDDWTPRPRGVSYGHDIEASWLLLEAAGELGDTALRERARGLSVRMARAVLDEAYDAEHGGIVYHRHADGTLDDGKEWWPQAEAVVGFLSAWEETDDDEFLDAALGSWAFIREHVVDRRNGEWFRRVSREGVVEPGHEKAGPWKCPYHNARACLEAMARAGRVRAAAAA